MKKILFLLIMTVALAGCKKPGCTDPSAINYNSNAEKDDGSCEFESTSDNIIVSGFITSDVTWTSDNVYELRGKVVVDNGATLTIEPGTVIKGDQGTGTLASALVIAKGSKIYAVGTPTEPIIFTSVLDNFGNLNENDNGMWGGLIILGNAPISAADGDAITQIEGIPVTDTYGAYGGNNPLDNSGRIEYISIRHGGALIGAGNEINGLTLGGVGSGTQISNIEIVGNLDDGVEFFGGTVNVSNIIVGFQGDDGIDIDMNYAGTVDTFIVINGAFSDEALEVDGPEGMTHTTGLFTLQNGECVGRGEFKSKAQGSVTNVKMTGLKIRASYQNDCQDPKTDAFTHLTQTGTLTFSSVDHTGITVYTTSVDNNTAGCPIPTVDQTSAENLIGNTALSPMSLDQFSWTWLSQNGKL